LPRRVDFRTTSGHSHRCERRSTRRGGEVHERGKLCVSPDLCAVRLKISFVWKSLRLGFGCRRGAVVYLDVNDDGKGPNAADCHHLLRTLNFDRWPKGAGAQVRSRACGCHDSGAGAPGRNVFLGGGFAIGGRGWSPCCPPACADGVAMQITALIAVPVAGPEELQSWRRISGIGAILVSGRGWD